MSLGELSDATDEHSARWLVSGCAYVHGQLELGILAEDRLVKIAQGTARLDAEPGDELLTRGLVDTECLCLSVRAVQGEHEPTAKPFPQRVLPR